MCLLPQALGVELLPVIDPQADRVPVKRDHPLPALCIGTKLHSS